MADGRVVDVVLLIVFEQTVVAFRVDVVVQVPTRYWGNGYGRFENIGSLAQTQAAHIPAQLHPQMPMRSAST